MSCVMSSMAQRWQQSHPNIFYLDSGWLIIIFQWCSQLWYSDSCLNYQVSIPTPIVSAAIWYFTFIVNDKLKTISEDKKPCLTQISIFPLLKTVVVGTPRRPVQVIPLLIWIFGSDPSRWQWCWCLVVRVSWCRRATTLSCSAHLRLSCVWQSTVKYFITPDCDSSDFNAVINEI